GNKMRAWLQLLRALLVLAVLPAVQPIGFAPELYCGMENCYDVLGIQREEFDRSTLSKIYRKVAKANHPDRFKGKEEKAEQEERFRVVATAYETLKENDTRTEYDYYLDHPEERFYNYYQYYRRRAIVKVDVWPVALVTILVISFVQHISAKQKYEQAVAYVIASGKFRHKAIDVGVQRKVLDMDKTGKLKKVRGRDNEAIIKSIIEENMDVKGGYRKPDHMNLLIVQMVILPYTLFKYAKWQAEWFVKYNLRKEEYSDEDKMYIVRKWMKLDQDQFDSLSDKEHDEMFRKQLWVKENFDPWKLAKDADEQAKNMASGKYKQYKRFMKNNNDSMSFLED
ncbi:hypothetical protein PFISCL1PPCAC_15786, partial [Pristionchus fissidentatus]